VTILYLVRHAETDANHEGRVQGHLDVPLNADGRHQAAALHDRLRLVPFDAAYSSDLRRARQTTEAVLAGRDLPLIPRADLRERFFARWEGLLTDEVAEREPENWKAWLAAPRETAPHGGESEVALERRITGALTAIVAAHPDDVVLVVSHGGAIRAALFAWLGLAHHFIANGGVFVLEIQARRRRLITQF
jgi:probable phosphoglycerate mutase